MSRTRTPLLICALAGLAIAPFLTCESSAVQSGVLFDGLLHYPLGQAVLSTDPNTGNLIVWNLGSSGQDGVRIESRAIANYDAAWMPFSPSDVYTLELRALTEDGTLRGRTTVTGTASGVQFDVETDGASTYDIEISAGSTITYSAVGVPGGSGGGGPSGGDDPNNPADDPNWVDAVDWHWSEQNHARQILTFLYPTDPNFWDNGGSIPIDTGSGTEVDGDAIRWIPNAGASVNTDPVRAIEITLSGVSTFELRRSTVTGSANIPTLGEWGLVGLSLLLGTGGVLMLRRL